MRKDILQKFIDEGDSYLIGLKHTDFLNGKSEQYAIFLSPDIDRELWDKKIGELTYNIVENFANKEIITNIYLGREFPPFQRGLRYKDIIILEKVTCNANELIHKCYTENITDFYKIKELMEELNK